jgi:hypothetical protein
MLQPIHRWLTDLEQTACGQRRTHGLRRPLVVRGWQAVTCKRCLGSIHWKLAQLQCQQPGSQEEPQGHSRQSGGCHQFATPKPAEVRCAQRRCLSPLCACRIPFEIFPPSSGACPDRAPPHLAGLTAQRPGDGRADGGGGAHMPFEFPLRAARGGQTVGARDACKDHRRAGSGSHDPAHARRGGRPRPQGKAGGPWASSMGRSQS